MNRKYDEALVTTMQNQVQEVEYEGITIQVKPIPEGGDDGDMDPRLYKSMKRMPLLMKFMPKPKAGQTVLESILPMRKMFGEYKGIQMVTDGIETTRLSVESADGYQVPVRVYKRSAAGSRLPMFVYYHGGGFFGGGPDIVEQMCKLLVANYDCVAFNVDYRLCPEHHYPAPLDDCFYATRWAYEHAARFGGDNTRMAVSGDSAGGNLAAAVTLRDREEGTGMVKAQVLIYPLVNMSGKNTDFYHGSKPERYHKSKKHAKVLNAMITMMSGIGGGSEMEMMDGLYLQGNLPSDHIYASPLLDSQHDVPPTLLMFGEHDMLVFQDIAYAKTLQAAGRSVQTIVYRGMGHGFADQIGVSPQAEDCILETAKFLQKTLK